MRTKPWIADERMARFTSSMLLQGCTLNQGEAEKSATRAVEDWVLLSSSMPMRKRLWSRLMP